MIAARISASRSGIARLVPGESERHRGRAGRDGGDRQRRNDPDAPVVSVPARLRFQRHSHARQSGGSNPFGKKPPRMTMFAKIPAAQGRRIGQTADSRRDIRHAEPYVIWRRGSRGGNVTWPQTSVREGTSISVEAELPPPQPALRRAWVALRSPTARYVAGVLALAAAYYGAAKLGQTLRYTASVSAIWPPAGLGIAALYLWGLRWWPGILLGRVRRQRRAAPRRQRDCRSEACSASRPATWPRSSSGRCCCAS